MTAQPKRSKEAFKLGREIQCVTPALRDVTIRPPNIEVHALSGGLPTRLKKMAAKGVKAIDEVLSDTDLESDVEMRNYLDGLVARLFVEPAFDPPEWVVEEEEHDDGTTTNRIVLAHGDDLDEYLLPVEYRWAILIAFGEQDEDGEGNTLWGRAPLSRFDPFPEEHGCSADCEGCERARDRVSLARAYARSTRTVALS